MRKAPLTSNPSLSTKPIIACGARFLALLAAIVPAALGCGGGGESAVDPRRPPPVPVASVIVSPPTANIVAGSTVTLAAILKAADGSILSDRPVVWNSGDTARVTVSATGQVTTWRPCTVSVTATSEGRTGTALITAVASAPLTWSSVYSGVSTSLNSVWGSGPTDVFVVGDTGTIIHYDGTGWHTMASGTRRALRKVWGTSANSVYAVGDAGTMLRYDGVIWTTIPSDTTKTNYAVWGNSASDIYVVQSGGLIHYNGATWSRVAEFDVRDNVLYDIWGTSATDIYAVGLGESPLVSPTTAGATFHYDGRTWTKVDQTDAFLVSVWGVAGRDIFTVGARTFPNIGAGRLRRFDGTMWRNVGEETASNSLNGVWGSAVADVYAVGDFATIVHFDGATWKNIQGGFASARTPTALMALVPLRAIWGSSASDVYAVGLKGSILRGTP